MGNSSSTPTPGDNDNNTEYEKLCLILVSLEFAAWHLQEQESLVTLLLEQIRSDERFEDFRREREKEKEKPKRNSFSEITDFLSEKQFRRIFRMHRDTFSSYVV